MAIHRNARLTPRGGARLVEQILDGRAVAEAAAASGVTAKTARKWLCRFQEAGAAGLADRSSRPHHSPSQLGFAPGFDATCPEQYVAGGAICRLARRQEGPCDVAVDVTTLKHGEGMIAAVFGGLQPVPAQPEQGAWRHEPNQPAHAGQNGPANLQGTQNR